MSRRVLILAAVLLAMGPASRADYIGLQATVGYNDFVLGDFTQYGTDSGSNGPNNGLGIAVGGNFAPANGGSFTVHGNVVVGGNYTNTNSSVDGNIYGYNNVTFSNQGIGGTVYAGNNVSVASGGEPTGGIRYVGAKSVPSYFSNTTQVGSVPHPVDFAAAASSLKAESAYLHGLAGIGTVASANNALTLSGTGSNTYIFHVSAAQFANINTFNILVSGLGGQTPTVVVDVDNGTAGASFANLTATYSGVTNQYVLFNFAGSGTINTNSDGIQGSVLAPNALVAFNSGNINGQMIAGSLSGTGESHAYSFLGSPFLPTAAVPEPASLALLGVGGLGGMAWLRRRKPGA